MFFNKQYPMAHRIQRPTEYVPACATDIRKTFERERLRLAREAFARGELPKDIEDAHQRNVAALVITSRGLEAFGPRVIHHPLFNPAI